MSTTPAPIPPTSGLNVKILNDMMWLKTHAILLILVVALAVGSVYGIESLVAKHDDETNARWQAINQSALSQVQSLNDRLAADEKDRAAQNAQQTAILSQLATSISQRDRTVATVIQKDQTLPAADIATKITEQVKASPGEVTAQGNNVQMDLSASRMVVSNLDQLPVTQDDLADAQKQLSAQTVLSTNAENDAADEKKIIAAMTAQASDADKACKASIADLKAQERKSKWKWLGVGYVLGLASAHFIGI